MKHSDSFWPLPTFLGFTTSKGCLDKGEHQNSSSGGLAIGMWVRIPVMTLGVLEQDTIIASLQTAPRGKKSVPARVEVDFMFEKALERHGSPGLYTSQGAENLLDCY